MKNKIFCVFLVEDSANHKLKFFTNENKLSELKKINEKVILDDNI
jgi:hypothetical protein